MRYAILSDVHGRLPALETVLADALRRGAEIIVSLGDVGSDACFDLLREAGAVGVFGNWEVSRWGDLSPANREYVLSLPPLLNHDSFLAVHAAPLYPAHLASVVDFLDYIVDAGLKWRQVFPYLDEDEEAIWQTVAELEMRGQALLFHGQTQRQVVGLVEPTGHLTRLRGESLTLSDQRRHIVGVGSVGQPEDGPWPSYALYDDEQNLVTLVRMRR